MRINDIVDDILHMCDGTLLSDIKSAPSDIDIYIPQENRNKYVSFLDENGYVLTCSSASNTVYRKYEDGLLYILDLISDFNVYTKFQPLYKFTELGSKRIGRSPELHKAIKKFSLNTDRSSVDLIPSDKLVIDFFTDPSNYSTHYINNFRILKRPNRAFLCQCLRKGILRSILVFFIKIKIYRLLLFTGKTIAFLGPDGAGKSYYINKLMQAGRTKKQYMGDWFFTFQFFYIHLLKFPSPFNRVVYIFYFFENMGRLAYVNFLKIKGYIVLIDRYPGTGQNVLQTGFLKKINDYIFWIFKKPTLFVLLSAPAQEVYARKQELSIEEISNITNSLKEKVSPYNHVIVETTDSDIALNLMMKKIFSFK